MLTVIGEALVDVVHSNDAPMHAYPGGSPLNVAVGAARLGHKTRFIGHYGTDEHGASIAAHLSASKVQVPSSRAPHEPQPRRRISGKTARHATNSISTGASTATPTIFWP